MTRLKIQQLVASRPYVQLQIIMRQIDFSKKCIRFDTIAHTDSSQISYSTRFSKLDFPSFFIKL